MPVNAKPFINERSQVVPIPKIFVFSGLDAVIVENVEYR